MASYTSYKRVMSVIDADDDNIETWITVKGNHIPIMKGQSKEEAVQAFIEKKSGKESAQRESKPVTVGEATKKVVKQAGENKAIREAGMGKLYKIRPGESGLKHKYDVSGTKGKLFVNGKEYTLKQDPLAEFKHTAGSNVVHSYYTDGEKLAKWMEGNLNSDDMHQHFSEQAEIMSGKKEPAQKSSLVEFAEKYNKWADKQHKTGTWNFNTDPTRQKPSGSTKKKEPAKKESAPKTEKFDYGEGWPKSPKFEQLTEKHMPKTGESDNELGEALRSINQAVYRYYNDGDMYNKGYGKETVNWAIKHLTELSKNKETPRHIARGLENGLFEMKKYGIKNKDHYETALKILLQTIELADEKDIDALSKMKRKK